MKSKQLWLITSIPFCLFLTNNYIYACSVWSAVGEKVKDKNTLIAKNWDFGDTNYAEFRISKQKGKYAFIGQFAYSEKDRNNPHDLDAGINEKGLVVLTTQAASVPRKERVGSGGCANHILTHFSSVDEALADKEHYKIYAAANYMIADNKKAAIIEIAPESKVNIRVIDNGVLYHTNHYTSKELEPYNKLDSSSSDGRFRRLQELMDNHKEPFTFDEFIAMSKDQHKPPNNGLWRVGSPTNHEKTLASFVAEISGDGISHTWMRTATTGEPIKQGEVNISKSFWHRHKHWDRINLSE